MADGRDIRTGRALRLVFWLVLAFTLVRALWPDPLTEEYVGPNDKIVHATAFLVLGLLSAAAFPARRLLILGVWLLAFGGLIEVLQAIPMLHRDSSFADLAADLVGVCAALAVVAPPPVRRALGRR